MQADLGPPIALDKADFQPRSINIFLISPNVSTGHLVEALLMTTHGICFYGEIRNRFTWIPHVSSTMVKNVFEMKYIDKSCTFI